MPRPIEEVQEILARQVDHCAPGCPGWIVMGSMTIQRCDACMAINRRRGVPALRDADVAELPEAQRALQGPGWYDEDGSAV